MVLGKEHMHASARVTTSYPVDPVNAAVAMGDAPEILEDIRDASGNLRIWRREPPVTIVGELASVTAAPVVEVRRPTSVRSFSDDLDLLMARAGLAPDRHPSWRADLALLARLFFPLTDGREVELRLELIDDDGCPRYHVDRSHLRMLCTYRGAGTEWLSDAQVDRAALRARAPNENIVRSGTPSRLAPFWVGLFKGSLNPGAVEGGLVHRSPALAGTGERRVLFCLVC